MAAKLCPELKAKVKEIRDRSKDFIDLRRTTNEELKAYIAKHEVETGITEERSVTSEVIEDIKQSDEYWLQWEAKYEKAIASLEPKVYTIANITEIVGSVADAVVIANQKTLRSRWQEIPSQIVGRIIKLLRRKKNEILSKCKSFRQMAIAASRLNKLGV